MDYNSYRWRKKREKILKKYDYMCQESKRYGKYVIANTVHHIYPVEKYPELEWEEWNMIPLTNEMHNAMHDRDTHEITALGKRWQERVQSDFDRFFSTSPPQVRD